MKKYIITKEVEAEPMTMGEFYQHAEQSQYKEMAEDDDNLNGYRVVYENGFEGWMPADLFEKLYHEGTIENASDGYHTFKELYHYRMLYNAAFFNELNRNGRGIPVYKSHRHSDGELCFGGGWFIVIAELPTGQVSNHYEDKYWDLFDIPEFETPWEWDGHSPNEAATRLENYLKDLKETDSFFDSLYACTSSLICTATSMCKLIHLELEELEPDTRQSRLLDYLYGTVRDNFKAIEYFTEAYHERPVDPFSLPFQMIIPALKSGFAVRRKGWNGKGLMVFKQVPAYIENEVIPKMQSLPQDAKDLILKGKGFIDYISQCLIYNENTGRADSWVPSISDIFAEDWEIIFP